MLLLLAAPFALWIGRKYFQRRRFLRQLEGDRITPEELQARLNAGEDLLIVDVRSGAAEDSTSAPATLRMSLEDLAARSGEIPRDREIILFCS